MEAEKIDIKDYVLSGRGVTGNSYDSLKEPGVLVTDGERLGIRFRKVFGKRSYSQSVHEEPERCEEFAREFARVCKRLHSTVLPSGTFPDSKDLFRGTVGKNKFLTGT